MTDTPEPDKVPEVVPDVTPEKVADEAPTPVDKPDPPKDEPKGDNPLEKRVEGLETAITDLSNAVAALAPVPGLDPEPEAMDETPAKRPWLYRGFGGKS